MNVAAPTTRDASTLARLELPFDWGCLAAPGPEDEEDDDDDEDSFSKGGNDEDEDDDDEEDDLDDDDDEGDTLWAR